ncbi:hypothetical protein [Mycobacterium sp. 23]|uniref:hypothetical protein n=1 Tax=Mycobacterium sp. 23 TaxID=3400424 RepID=UPI003AAE3FE4
MIAGLQAFAFAIAAAATVNGTVSWSAEMLSDSKAWWVLALVCLGVFLALKHVEVTRRRREARRREWMRDYRGAWFASFERRQRVIAAREAGR